jgi:hypothetical protein
MFVAAVRSAALPLVSGASGDGPFVKMAATPSSGAAGTVVTLSAAEDQNCPSQTTLALGYMGIDETLYEGEPFPVPDGTFTVPSVAPGEYMIGVSCNGLPVDGVFFRVEPGTVSAQPNMTG